MIQIHNFLSFLAYVKAFVTTLITQRRLGRQIICKILLHRAALSICQKVLNVTTDAFVMKCGTELMKCDMNKTLQLLSLRFHWCRRLNLSSNGNSCNCRLYSWNNGNKLSMLISYYVQTCYKLTNHDHDQNNYYGVVG